VGRVRGRLPPDGPSRPSSLERNEMTFDVDFVIFLQIVFDAILLAFVVFLTVTKKDKESK
jgi:large-conductance mechanosensitive channel